MDNFKKFLLRVPWPNFLRSRIIRLAYPGTQGVLYLPREDASEDANADDGGAQGTHPDCVDVVVLESHLENLNLSKERVNTNGHFNYVLEQHVLPAIVQEFTLTGKKGISQVPTNIGKLVNLRVLNLQNNSIRELSWAIVYLRNLETLNLSDNELVILPPTIGKLGALQILDVSKNRLTGLPTQLLQLTNLRKLNVSGNTTLVSPPLSVCEKGLAAIIEHTRKRLCRLDLWEFTKPWIDGKQRKGPHAYGDMKSLLDACVDCLFLYRIDYLSCQNVPPVVKTQLVKCAENYQTRVQLAKCSVCSKFYSTKAKFDNHDCRA